MAQTNRLVITLEPEQRILHYQVAMLQYNPHPGIIPFNTQINNNSFSLHYAPGSSQPLSHWIKRGHLPQGEGPRLLAKLAHVLLDSQNLLLNPASFRLEIPHVYLDPANREPALVYLPLEPRSDVRENLLAFADSMRLSGPLLASELQSISDYLQRDFVSLQEFGRFLTRGRLPERNLPTGDKNKPFRLKNKNQLGDKREKGKISLIKNIENIELFSQISSKKRSLLFFAIIQAVLALLLVWCSGYLDQLGEPVITYLGVAVLLGALDVLVLKALFTCKLSKPKLWR